MWYFRNFLFLGALVFGASGFTDGQVSREFPLKESVVDREFLVGDRAAFALVGIDPCSFVIGSVEAVTVNSLTLKVREKLGQFPVVNVDGWMDVSYKRPRKNNDIYEVGFTPQALLDNPRTGQDLGLFVCPRKYSYSTTDEKEIASLRRAVEHFLKYKKRPETILEVPRTLDSENDRIFATYLAMFVTRNGAIAFPDYTLTVVSQLMENDKFLSSYKGKWRQELGMRMVRSLANLIEVNEVFVAKPETREDSLRRVIEVACSQKPFAPFALRAIARVKADGSVDLDRYLDVPTITKLRLSYTRFTVKELGNDDHAVLGRLLAASS